VAGTCTENGGLQNTSSGYTVGTEGLQEKAGNATWEEAEKLVTDRTEWRQRVAQCIRQDVGWTKV